MAIATFRYEGLTVDYTPSSDVSAGDIVVLGDMVGVAKLDIDSGDKGSIAVTGIFDVAKGTDAADIFAVGEPVYYSTADEEATAGEAGNIRLGTCVAAAAQTDTMVTVRLEGVGANTLFEGLVWEEVDIDSSSKTLDAQDVCKVLNVSGDDTNVVTLPATAANVRFVIRAATSGIRVAVSPNANDKIMGADVAGADNKDWILTAATALAGDYIVLEGDGDAGFYVSAVRGIWTQEA